jgi:hypothetical protein
MSAPETVAQRPRPSPKRLLPIKLVSSKFNRQPSLELEYRGHHGGTEHLLVGPPLSDTTPGLYRDPLGVAIVQLVEAYYALEAEHDGLAKERDEALQRALAAEAELRTHERSEQVKEARAKKPH